MNGMKKPIIVKKPDAQISMNVGLVRREKSSIVLMVLRIGRQHPSVPGTSVAAASSTSPPVGSRVTDAWYASDDYKNLL